MTIKEFSNAAKRDYMRNPQRWLKVASDECICQFWSKGVSYFARVHPKDLKLVSKYRWYLKDGYAITSISYKRVKMHHLIVGKPPEGKVTDHINRDRLDNRRSNLRFLSPQSSMNNTKPGKGYRKKGNMYEAYIQSKKKWISLGYFPTEKEASDAYTKAKIKYHKI